MSEVDLRSALNFEAAGADPDPGRRSGARLPGDRPTPAQPRPEQPAQHADPAGRGPAGHGRTTTWPPSAPPTSTWSAVDPVALAMLRAVPPAPVGVAEAVVSIGGDLTTIAVREGHSTRFVRVLNIGGSDLTEALSRELAVNAQSAEDMKRRAANGAPVAVAAQAQSALSLRMGGLVDEVRGSLDFFLAQTDTDHVGRVILTGGAIQTEGLVARLEQALGASVEVANPLAVVAVGKTGSERSPAPPVGALHAGAHRPGPVGQPAINSHIPDAQGVAGRQAPAPAGRSRRGGRRCRRRPAGRGDRCPGGAGHPGPPPANERPGHGGHAAGPEGHLRRRGRGVQPAPDPPVAVCDRGGPRRRLGQPAAIRSPRPCRPT